MSWEFTNPRQDQVARARVGAPPTPNKGNRHVRFTPKSGHVQCSSRCLLWAKSGHQRTNLRSTFSSNELEWRDATIRYVLNHVLYFLRCVPTHQNVKPKRWWATGCRGFGPQLIVECNRKVTSVTFGNDRKAGPL